MRIGNVIGTKSDQTLPNGKLVSVVSRSELIQALASEPSALQHDEQGDRAIRLEVLARLGEQSRTGFGERNIVAANGVVHVWDLVRSPEESRALQIGPWRTQSLRRNDPILLSRDVVVGDLRASRSLDRPVRLEAMAII
jgi:hypothetical protein